MQINKIGVRSHNKKSNVAFERLIIRKSAINREYLLIVNHHSDMIKGALERAHSRLSELAKDIDIIISYSEADKKTPAELCIKCKRRYNSFIEKIKNFDFLDEGEVVTLNPDNSYGKHFDDEIVKAAQKNKNNLLKR